VNGQGTISRHRCDNYLSFLRVPLKEVEEISLVPFTSVAHIWRVKMKDQFLRLSINNNPNAPPIWRVNSPLMNNPHFYTAFDIKPCDSLDLGEKRRCHIW